MSKELPKMYQNKDVKNNRHVQKVYTSLYDDGDRKEKEEINLAPVDGYTIMQKIYNIFNSKDYIYKIDVYIKTDEGTFPKRIIGKNKDYLITIDNEYIPINKIKDIYR